MIDEENQIDQGPQEQEEQGSPFDQTGQVTDKAKRIGKQTLKGLRGLGVAGKTAETAAEAGTAAGAGGATTAGVTTGAAAGEAGAAATTGAAAGATGAATGAASAAGSSLGAWALVAVVAVIFIMTVLIAIIGSQQVTTATNYSPTPAPPPVDFTPACGDQIDSYLVSLNIDAKEITDCGRKQLLFKTVLRVLSYPGYKTLIGEQSLVFIAKDDGTSCGNSENYWGCTKSSSKVWLKNFDDPNDKTPWQYVITHELFHVFGIRDRTVVSLYRGLNNSFIQNEIDCYRISPTSSVIKTYDFDTKDIGESFAESGTLYILGGRKNISDFKSQCPNNYSFWAQAIGEPSGGDGEPQPPGGSGERCTAGNTNTCGGKYNISKNQDGLNFGDPSCQLTNGGSINRDAVRSEIMSQLQTYNKTKDYCRWSCIAYHEGGYNPNSYNGNASRPNLGAWGMFQFLPWACYASDKPYYYNRTGNVDWKEQIKRALKLEYNSLEPNNLDWRYWSTYKWTCSKEPDWSPGTTCRSMGQ